MTAIAKAISPYFTTPIVCARYGTVRSGKTYPATCSNDKDMKFSSKVRESLLLNFSDNIFFSFEINLIFTIDYLSRCKYFLKFHQYYLA